MNTRLASAALAALLAPLAYGSCPMHPDAPPELSANHDCCRIAQEKWESAAAALRPSPESLYQVESIWTNQSGASAPLGRLAGKPQLVAMAYTHCEYACPRLLADLQSIEKALEDRGKLPEIGFALVSIDPDRDTPERLHAYAQERALDLARWTLLQGSKGDTLELANLLGVRYAATPTGDYTHSNIITLLDAQGEVVFQLNGLGADNAPMLAQIEALLATAP